MDDWKAYTPQELEAQYNVRASLPDHPAVIERWARASARYRAGHGHASLDLRYGERPLQTLDFLPAHAGSAPLHLFIHGGYWQRMDKRDFSFLAEPLNAAGVHVALLNYDLCPAVELAAIVAEVRAALSWLWRAEALAFDRQRLQIGGHSAGAHLAAMLLAADWPDLAPELPRRPIHSAVLISGLYQLEPLVTTSINAALGLDGEQARRLSPTLLPPRVPAPLLLAVGAAETAEFHRQADLLAERWRPAGTAISRLVPERRDHFTVLDEFGAAHGTVARAALALLRSPGTG